MQPQKAGVVVGVTAVERLVQFLFNAFCGFLIAFVAGGMIHLPQHTRPETVGPPTDSSVGHINIFSVFRNVRDLVPDAVNFSGHFGLDFAPNFVQPFLIFSSQHINPPSLC